MGNSGLRVHCEQCCEMLDGEISNYVDILQGVVQGCCTVPGITQSIQDVYINDTIVAVEAA